MLEGGLIKTIELFRLFIEILIIPVFVWVLRIEKRQSTIESKLEIIGNIVMGWVNKNHKKGEG